MDLQISTKGERLNMSHAPLQTVSQRFEITRYGKEFHDVLPRRLFLEASAGTGKTFTIEHYLLRSILESSFDEEPLTAQQSLIVTFTRAAATELKDRIQERLKSAYVALEIINGLLLSEGDVFIERVTSSQESLSFIKPEMAYLLDYVFGTSSETRNSIQYCLERVWKLRYSLSRYMSDIDYASISTIHSFFDRIAGEYRESRAEQHCDRGVWLTYDGIADWIRECVSWSLPPDLMKPKEWESLMASFQRNEEDFLKKISYRLSDESTRKVLKNESVQPTGEEIRKNIWLRAQEKMISHCQWKRESLDQIIESFIVWAKGKKGSVRRGENEVSHEFVEAFEQLILSLFHDQYSEVVSQQLFTSYRVLHGLFSSEEKKVRAKKNIDEASLSKMAHFVNEVWPVIDKAFSPDGLFERLYEVISSLFCRYLESGKVKTPQSVIEEMYSLTSEGESSFFVDFVSKRFKLVIIDEFQDTDAYQWKTFRSLFIDTNQWDGRILFVGDPKQAIYAFRKADVYSYLDAKRCFRDDEKMTLGTNWRASKYLVQGINCFFSDPQAAKWLFYLPRHEASLSSEVLEAPSQLLPFSLVRPQSSVHFFLSSKEIGRKKSWPSQEVEEEILFPWIARECLLLQNIEKISLSEIAILVKDRYQAARAAHFLREQGLSSVMVRVDPVTESPIFSLFIALLDLLDSPHDVKKMAAFFISAKSSRCIKEACLFTKDKFIFAHLVQSWSKVRDAFLKDGFGGLIYALEKTSVIDGLTLVEWISSIYGGDKQFLIDLDHLLEIASILFSQFSCTTLQEIKRAFSHLPSLFHDDPDLLMRRFDVSEDAIQIMTMHRSKGLEFPIVFALGAASRTPIIEEEENARGSFERKALELDAEKMRQFYVACTRAKRRLYLPFCVEASLKETDLGTKAPLELFFLGHKQAHLHLHHSSSDISLEEWKKAMYQSLSYEEVIAIIDAMKERDPTLSSSITYSTDKELEETLHHVLQEEAAILDKGILENQSCEASSSIELDESFDSNTMHVKKFKTRIAARKYISFSSLLRTENERGDYIEDSPTSRLFSFFMKEAPVLEKTQEGQDKKSEDESLAISQRIFGVRFHAVIDAWVSGHGISSAINYDNPEEAIHSLTHWISLKFPAWKETASQLGRMLYYAVTIQLPLSLDNKERVSLHRLSRSVMSSEQHFLDLLKPQGGSSPHLQVSLMQGSIDLVVIVNNRLFLLDWKTNKVSDDISLEKYVYEMGYHLQARGYIETAHRYISSIKSIDKAIDLSFGGFIFIFLERIVRARKMSHDEPCFEVGVLFKDAASAPEPFLENLPLLNEREVLSHLKDSL